MKPQFDWRDLALRTLLVVSGVLSAVLLAMKGQAQVLPALAVGGMLGAVFMARVSEPWD